MSCSAWVTVSPLRSTTPMSGSSARSADGDAHLGAIVALAEEMHGDQVAGGEQKVVQRRKEQGAVCGEGGGRRRLRDAVGGWAAVLGAGRSDECGQQEGRRGERLPGRGARPGGRLDGSWEAGSFTASCAGTARVVVAGLPAGAVHTGPKRSRSSRSSRSRRSTRAS